MNISGPAAVAKPEMLFYAPGDLTVTQENWQQAQKRAKRIADHIVGFGCAKGETVLCPFNGDA